MTDSPFSLKPLDMSNPTPPTPEKAISQISDVLDASHAACEGNARAMLGVLVGATAALAQHTNRPAELMGFAIESLTRMRDELIKASQK